MNPTNSHHDFLPQDAAEDDSGLETNSGQPLSEAEIEDLLYGSERSSAELLALLRELREDIASRKSADFGDRDPEALARDIDDRIAQLSGAERDGEKPGALDPDPLAHRETLSPDSDELDAIEQADEDSLDEEDEWLDEEDSHAEPPDNRVQ